MKHQDFRITISGRNRARKHRFIISSPAGGCAERFTNPISTKALHDLLAKNGLRAARKGTGENATARNPRPVTSTDDLNKIGEQLSEALFHGLAQAAYAQSKASVAANGEGLRLRISIDPSIDQYTELMSLPWEFLYDHAANEHLGLTLNRAIVRDPIVLAPSASLQVEDKLRILAVYSNPKGYPPLNLKAEVLRLEEIGKIPGIEVEFLKNPTINEVARELRKEQEEQKEVYHIFHFMGHGEAITRNRKERNALVFTNADGNASFVDGQALRLVLAEPGSIRLVFLNACETAKPVKGAPFASIPIELLSGCIPGVVAMQFPISDPAAITFCAEFYKRLVKGVPVDQCMGEARRSIFFSSDASAEWGTPVLFMNSPDGKFFDFRKTTKRKKTAQKQGTRSQKKK